MSTYFRLLTYIKPHLRIFGLAIACMAIFALFKGAEIGAIFPLADRIITDKVIPSPGWLPGWASAVVAWLNATPSSSLLLTFAWAIPFVFLLRGLFEFWQRFFMQDASQRVIRDLRQALFDKFVRLSSTTTTRRPRASSCPGSCTTRASSRIPSRKA